MKILTFLNVLKVFVMNACFYTFFQPIFYVPKNQQTIKTVHKFKKKNGKNTL